MKLSNKTKRAVTAKPDGKFHRINLWSCPRNLSTALMYSFAQRPDTAVYDEPLYAHYLRVTGVDHPGRDLIMQNMENDGDKVVRDLMLGPLDKSIALFKQMTHHLIQMDDDFLPLMQHVLFIRDPRRIIHSYSKVRQRPNLYDIGIQRQTALFRRLNSLGLNPIVLDSADLQNDPKKMLNRLCEALGIEFDEVMLNWPARARPEDGPWAPWWYNAVHRSSCFLPATDETIRLSGDLAELEREARPWYDYLYAYRLRSK